MPCYRPLPAMPSFNRLTGKTPYLVFPRNEVNLFKFKSRVPCGRCIGCRLEHSRQWATRIVHESRLYTHNSFITLTYANEFLPTYDGLVPSGDLILKDLQDFTKRLREHLDRKFSVKIRYFACGEYGEQFKRPHFHLCIFGYEFPDSEFLRFNKLNQPLYRSKFLEQVWPFGYNVVGDLTFESAAYVSRYCTKKITGDASLSHYAVIDSETGEVLLDKRREFAVMSRNPGLGRYYFDRYFDSWYTQDFLVINRKGKNVNATIPRYYNKCYELLYPEDYDAIKEKRRIKVLESAADNTTERLLVREKVKLSQIKSLTRSL